MIRRMNTLLTAIPAMAFALGLGAHASFADPSRCQSYIENTGDQSELIKVSAEVVTVTGSKNTVELDVDPVLTQGNLCLSASRILATYAPGSGELLTMSAFKDVVFFRGQDRAASEAAHYDVESRVLVLEGDVILRRDGSTVAADKVTIGLENETVTFAGNVRSAINPVSGE